jgi:hypothetical protein
MTARQRAKLSMFQDIASVCAQYRHVWNALPALKEAVERFDRELNSLREVAGTQRRDTGGAAQEKVEAREQLCSIAFEIAAATRASALSSGDTKAASKIAFSLTQLRIGKDELCLERCRQILATAEKLQRQLEPFGVTTHRIAELSQRLDSFTSATEKTRQLRTANKKITTRLPSAFKTVETILYTQLDNLIPQFRTAAPRFFAQYQESRVMRALSNTSQTVAEPDAEEPPLLD